MILIGLSGKARVGKDTAGTYLYNKLSEINYNTFITAYANQLKQDLIDKFGLSFAQVHGDLKEVPDTRYPKQGTQTFWTPREMMQAYGQFMRSFDKDYWVKALFKVIDTERNHLVITDLRQPNEVKAILDRGGFHIRLFKDDRPEINGKDHETERALDNSELPVHYVVNNNGSKEELFTKLDEILDEILQKEEQSWQAKRTSA